MVVAGFGVALAVVAAGFGVALTVVAAGFGVALTVVAGPSAKEPDVPLVHPLPLPAAYPFSINW